MLERVKIFTANGLDEIKKVEKDINAWLVSGSGRITVKHTDAAMCQLAESPSGERYQSLVVTVWYE